MLFTGFMLTPFGPKVLEYNVRFGDPETEALMLLLSEDVDLAALLLVNLAPYPFEKHATDLSFRLVQSTAWTQFQ